MEYTYIMMYLIILIVLIITIKSNTNRCEVNPICWTKIGLMKGVFSWVKLNIHRNYD